MAAVDALTGGGLLAALVAVVALMELIILTGKAADTMRSLRGPRRAADARVEAVSAAQREDRARLDRHEAELTGLREGQRQLCQGVQALLEHALHNGNSDEMDKASREIQEWLRNR